MADALSSLLAGLNQASSDALASLGPSVFDEVVIDSQFSPEYSMNPWAALQAGGQAAPPAGAAPAGPGTIPLVGGYVKPRIRLRKAGQLVATIAPYGEPDGNWLPNAVGTGAAVVAGIAWVLGLRKTATFAGVIAAGGLGLGYLTRPTS